MELSFHLAQFSGGGTTTNKNRNRYMPATGNTDMASEGVIYQVIGSTFDCCFPEDDLPDIYNALQVMGGQNGQRIDLVGEVQQHLCGGQVRAIALGPTNSLSRGMESASPGRSRTQIRHWGLEFEGRALF